MCEAAGFCKPSQYGLGCSIQQWLHAMQAHRSLSLEYLNNSIFKLPAHAHLIMCKVSWKSVVTCSDQRLTCAGPAARWFDNTLVTTFRGQLYYDGGLSNFIPLPPGVDVGVRVCCLPARQLKTVYPIDITPDKFEDWPYTASEVG